MSVREWSVIMLNALPFNGDVQSLAAYFEVLVEHNCNEEAGNLAVLRERTVAEFACFVDKRVAEKFACSLIRFVDGTHISSGMDKHFVLALRNVPPHSFRILPIFEFFTTYGVPHNIQLVTGGRVFIVFAQKESAWAAAESVEVVMGNPGIQLDWASVRDFEAASMILTERGLFEPFVLERTRRFSYE